MLSDEPFDKLYGPKMVNEHTMIYHANFPMVEVVKTMFSD